MGRKKQDQLSIFDLVLETPKEAEEVIVEVKETPLVESTVEKEPKIKIPTIDEIIKMYESTLYRVDRSKFLSDLFECGAIAISNSVDWKQAPAREERYKQIMSGYELKERQLLGEIFNKIFTLLSSMTLSYGEFNDWLGVLFMRSETSNSKAGQFFTPYCISKLCAQTTVNKEFVKDKQAKGEILSISEPACGSGGMVLATLDVLWNECNFNYTQNCFVEASDIDARCVHMCYLQLSLAGVPAIIKQQNTLTRELYSVWYTPAYLFQYLRFRGFEKVARV